MSIRVGIAIARRAACLVGLMGRGRKTEVFCEARIARAQGETVEEILSRLIENLPKRFRGARLLLSLSAGDLACADAWELSEKLTPTSLTKLAAGLCEARCAGETLENLSLDVIHEGPALQAAAIRTELLDAIRSTAAAKKLTLVRVTSIPAALASVFSKDGLRCLAWGGEEFEIRPGPLWRSFPIDHLPSGTAPILRLFGKEISPESALAMAAALARSDEVPDALRGASDRPRSLVGRLRGSLLSLGAAAALFFLAAGVWFSRENSRLGREAQAAIARERELWIRYLPGQSPRAGDLARAMTSRLKEIGEDPQEREWASALAFWAEIGARLPDPEALGLTLESLDLSPEGGRLAALVLADPRDRLKNAALLETHLNASARLAARGDFEGREKDVQVRLRLDFRK